MKRIFKYPLRIEDHQELTLPRFSEILCVKVQDRVPMLYAMVDEEEPFETVFVHIIGTGHPNTFKGMKYIDTIQLGYFVWHVFV